MRTGLQHATGYQHAARTHHLSGCTPHQSFARQHVFPLVAIATSFLTGTTSIPPHRMNERVTPWRHAIFLLAATLTTGSTTLTWRLCGVPNTAEESVTSTPPPRRHRFCSAAAATAYNEGGRVRAGCIPASLQLGRGCGGPRPACWRSQLLPPDGLCFPGRMHAACSMPQRLQLP